MRTKGIGIMTIATKPKSEVPQWYVRWSYICWVNSGNAVPMMLPTYKDGQSNSFRNLCVRKKISIFTR